MFSKELENLIQATLEDGQLTDFEKNALVKRARAEGVDLDELEIYITSLQQKHARERNEQNEEMDRLYRQKKAEAYGRVCPDCGKQLPPLALTCECGYEFTVAKANSSIEKLLDKLSSVELTDIEGYTVRQSSSPEKERDNLIADKKITIISLSPVPNTKEDIIEFLVTSVSEATKSIGFFAKKSNRVCLYIILAFIPIYGWFAIVYLITQKNFGVEEKIRKAWIAKTKQVLMKGRSLRSDKEFTQQLNYFEGLLKKGTKKSLLFPIALIVLSIVISLLSLL